MRIKLAFLGTGTCNSTSRNPVSLAFSNGDEVVLVDFGGGAYHQISRLGDPFFNYRNISTFFITHFHIDHVSGLPDFFWGEMWDSSGARENPVVIAGPRGLKSFYRDRLLPFLGNYPLPYGVNLIELNDGDKYEGSFYSVRSYHLSHSDPSTGYLFEFDGIKLAVTGDTGYCENLPALLSISDAAVMEWSIAGRDSYPGHISSGDIIRLIEKDAIPERIFINHIYPVPGAGYKEQVKMNRSILEGCSERFYFPFDLEIVDLI